MSLSAVDPRANVEAMATEVATQVTAFARACKAATRTVALYPAEHPTVGTALESVTLAAQVATSSSALQLAVLPDTLTVDGRHLAKTDVAVSEFAALLHSHQVGQLTLHPLTDADLWRRFLGLLALPPDQARLRGGLGKLWALEGQPRIEVRSLDYRELLRGDLTGDRETWDRIVSACLDGDTSGIDDEMLEILFGILDDPSKVEALVGAVEAQTKARAGDGRRSPLVVAGLLQALARYVETTHRDRLDQAMAALAEATGRLPVETLQPIVRAGRADTRPDLARFVKELAARIPDGTLADMVATEVRGGRGTSRQLADAFCGLVPDVDRRSAILTLARTAIAPATAPLGPELAQAWQATTELLLTYSDKAFVSDAYNVELTHVAERAVELDNDSTDPPGQLACWRGTVDDERVRGLDAELIVDLMQLQADPSKWRPLADLALSRVNVLLVLGDFNAAAFFIEAIRRHAAEHTEEAVREAASDVIGNILTPAMMRHVASHLDTSDADIVAAARRFCEALGPSIVAPLADVLSREERPRPRQHLVAILIGFGAAGRQAVERLSQSPNGAVRRTAVLLLREFGGRDALDELESLLGDADPNVQREAALAIAMMGVEPAFDAFARALSRGVAHSNSTIMGVIWTMPDDDAQPLLSYIVQHVPLRGTLWWIHQRAILRLGAIGGPRATLALSAVLERQKVWAPFRIRALHKLALTALARVNLPDAWRVLDLAAVGGPRHLRSTARALLASRPAAAERTPA